MKRKLFSTLSVVALLVAGVFIAKANSKFAVYTGNLYTLGQSQVATNVTTAIPVYTTTTFSTTQAELNGVGLYWISSGVSKKLYQ